MSGWGPWAARVFGVWGFGFGVLVFRVRFKVYGSA